jgi:hypothetical protein
MSPTEKKTFANPPTAEHRALALWAAACAERVLPVFEGRQPDDARPRLALAALRAWVRGEQTVVQCRQAAFAAHAAARATPDPAATAAARATGQAAAVAHMYSHAPHAAAYAAKAAALTVAPAQAAAAAASERAWQWAQLREDLRLMVASPKQ